MRRLFLILLLFAMPFQAAWAAGAAYCTHNEKTMHPGHHTHKHASSTASSSSSSASSQDDASPSDPCNDCDACHHLSASAVLSSQPNLPLPKGAPHLRGETRRYVSHVPDLIPPPDRLLRI